MVYIDSTKEFMMSGGVDDAHSHSADWWAFDTTNRSWHELDPQDPPWGGPFIPMVYDPDDDVVIMFGGHFEDTLWIYDVQDLLWEVRIPDNSPSQRTNHSAAYIGNGLMMVHGGETLEGTALNDTWMYNYTSDVWTEAVTTNAPIASGNGMAYIPEMNEVLMFGADPWPQQGGTWVFNVSTSNWSSPHLTPEPALRAYYGIAYLTMSGRVLMCGGGLQKHYEPPGDYSEPNRWNTWEFDAVTSTWHQVMPDGYHRVVYADNGTYLIGLEIWQLRSDRYWERVYADSGNLSRRTGHAAAYMEHRREIVLFGGMPGPGPVASPDRLNDIWVFDASESRWIEAHPEASPPPRDDHAMVYDRSHGNIVMFGGTVFPEEPPGGWPPGQGPGQPSQWDDTWLYFPDNDTWVEVTPDVSPAPRCQHVMAYLPSTQEIMLFGGMNTSNNPDDFDDVWIYNQSTNTWRDVTSPASPWGRYAAAAAYHPGLGGVLLYGGDMVGDGFFEGFNDTWIYHPRNNTWVELDIDAPQPRWGAQMVYEPSMEAILLFGGNGWNDTSREHWILSDPPFLGDGAYVSEVIDLGGEAYFGRIWIDPEFPDSTSVEVQLRSGGTVEELEGRPFTGAYTSSSNVDGVHNGSRFLQYRAKLRTADTSYSPVLDRVEFSYNLMHSVHVTSPLEGEEWTGTPNITWDATDPDGDRLLYDVHLVWDEGEILLAANLSTTWFEWDSSSTPMGYYWIRVVAKDDNAAIPLEAEGLSGRFALIHSTPPLESWLISPPDGAVLEDSPVVLEWDLTSVHRGWVDNTLIVGSSPDELETGGTRWVTTGTSHTMDLPEGIYYWTVIPGWGECSSGVWSFKLDTNVAPEVRLLSPVDGAVVGEVEIILDWKAHDDDGDDLSFTIFLGMDPSEVANHTGTMIQSLQEGHTLDVDPGVYYWMVAAHDGRVNGTSEIWSFEVLGSITITCIIDQPRGGDVVSGKVSVQGRVENASEGVVVRIRVDQGEWALVDGGMNWTYVLDTDPLESSRHTIEVWARDGDLESNATVVIQTSNGDLIMKEPWLWFVLVVIIVAVGVAAYVVRDRREG